MGFWDVTTMQILRKLGGDIKRSAPTVAIPKDSYEFNQGTIEAETTQFPKVGDLITLTLDGTVYSETAKSILLNDMEYVYIGNDSVLGGVDTGENYVASFIPVAGAVELLILDENGDENASGATHTVELSFKTQTIVPIDTKYLPIGGAGYTERSDPIVIISKGSYELYNGFYETQITQCPNAGDLITLTLDGAVYSAPAKSHALEDGTEFVYIGNGAADGGEDTGETYFAGFMSSEGAAIVAIVAEEGNEQTSTHTVEVSYTTQNIVPINPKYLPCVTLETIISLSETTISEADAKKMEALAAIGMPAVLKFKYETSTLIDVAGWCSYMKSEGTTMFKCRLGAYETEISFTFSGAGGEWKCYYSLE